MTVSATPRSPNPALTADVALQIAESAPEVTVVGDVILDSWVYGSSERLAREAPAPVVDRTHEVFAPGGAANTAMNLAAMGARVRLCGVTGLDATGKRLRSLLREAGIDTSGLLAEEGLTTTTKSRIVVDDQVLFRLDDSCAQASDTVYAQLAEAAAAAAGSSSALIICDYDGPVHHQAVLGRLAELPSRPLTIVDAHDPRKWVALRPDLITPNAAEVEQTIGEGIGSGAERIEAVVRSTGVLLERTGAACAAVTLDSEGTVVVDSRGTVHRTWANPAQEKLASGAGDTHVSALTLGLATGHDLPVSADLAQTAADIVVHRLGTSLCGTEDLVRYLDGDDNVLVDAEELDQIVRELRAHGQRIVLTNGCFDVLHRGHTSYLAKARQQGDILIVAVNDDDSTRRLKGPDRPINELADRAGVLDALNCVDYVTSFSGDTPIPLIRLLRPEIYAKGGDYTPQMLTETAEVEAYGGEVRIMDYVSDHSTTAVVQRIRHPAPEKGGAS